MSRTRRSDYPKTGKEVGHGEFPESFRIKQRRGLVRNPILDHKTRDEICGPKLKRGFKKNRIRKERRNIKQDLKRRGNHN